MMDSLQYEDATDRAQDDANHLNHQVSVVQLPSKAFVVMSTQSAKQSGLKILFTASPIVDVRYQVSAPVTIIAKVLPCYCGDETHRQLERFEQNVPGRLTNSFNGVTFHLSVDKANTLALKINGEPAATVHQDNNQPEAAQQEEKEIKTMARKVKYDGPINAPSVQKMLQRILKRNSSNPLKDVDLKGQYPKRIARRLAAHKLVASETREDVGLVFFAKA